MWNLQDKKETSDTQRKIEEMQKENILACKSRKDKICVRSVVLNKNSYTLYYKPIMGILLLDPLFTSLLLGKLYIWIVEVPYCVFAVSALGIMFILYDQRMYWKILLYRGLPILT